jgi:tRNA (mo5U34)-methyltransferase
MHTTQNAQGGTQTRIATEEMTGTLVSNRERISRRVEELGEWFHNLDLYGVQTAPNHFLGDFPNIKWKHIASAIPEDLSGATVLDIGCNGGFYCLEMKVVGVDIDERYLNQARFAAETLGFDVEFEKRSVYDVDQIEGQFDYVLFLGVFYHLRYPLYALDKVIKKVRGQLVFQTMIRGSENVRVWDENYHFWNKEVFENPEFPRMYFVEKSYANDPTNWWIPNRSAAEAMLRSSGLKIVSHPETETWVCLPQNVTRDGHYILDMELAGTL